MEALCLTQSCLQIGPGTKSVSLGTLCLTPGCLQIGLGTNWIPSGKEGVEASCLGATPPKPDYDSVLRWQHYESFECFIKCGGNSHKTVSIKPHFLKTMVSWSASKPGSSTHQRSLAPTNRPNLFTTDRLVTGLSRDGTLDRLVNSVVSVQVYLLLLLHLLPQPVVLLLPVTLFFSDLAQVLAGTGQFLHTECSPHRTQWTQQQRQPKHWKQYLWS